MFEAEVLSATIPRLWCWSDCGRLRLSGGTNLKHEAPSKWMGGGYFDGLLDISALKKVEADQRVAGVQVGLTDDFSGPFAHLY